MYKKAISFLLVLCMLFSMVPFGGTALAADGTDADPYEVYSQKTREDKGTVLLSCSKRRDGPMGRPLCYRRLLSTAVPPGTAMELIYQSKPVAQPQSTSPWSNTVVGTRMKGW